MEEIMLSFCLVTYNHENIYWNVWRAFLNRRSILKWKSWWETTVHRMPQPS